MTVVCLITMRMVAITDVGNIAADIGITSKYKLELLEIHG